MQIAWLQISAYFIFNLAQMFACSDLHQILCWLCPDEIQLWWEPAKQFLGSFGAVLALRVVSAPSCATCMALGTSLNPSAAFLNGNLGERWVLGAVSVLWLWDSWSWELQHSDGIIYIIYIIISCWHCPTSGDNVRVCTREAVTDRCVLSSFSHLDLPIYCLFHQLCSIHLVISDLLF